VRRASALRPGTLALSRAWATVLLVQARPRVGDGLDRLDAARNRLSADTGGWS
jgi:hypothetical protein